jgi:hypothetical protein
MDELCLMDPSCPTGSPRGDSLCILGWEDCIVCEDLASNCFEQSDCDPAWCETWVSVCGVDFCDDEETEFPNQGSCTVSLWGIGKLATAPQSRVKINGSPIAQQADCASTTAGYTVVSDDELLFCEESCAELEQAGGGSIQIIGWCE